jgi:hypothetical protein
VERLLVITDAYAIDADVVLLSPFIELTSKENGPLRFDAILKRPDGSSSEVRSQISPVRDPSKPNLWWCAIKGIAPNEVPIGSELWTSAFVGESK